MVDERRGIGFGVRWCLKLVKLLSQKVIEIVIDLNRLEGSSFMNNIP